MVRLTNRWLTGDSVWWLDDMKWVPEFLLVCVGGGGRGGGGVLWKTRLNGPSILSVRGLWVQTQAGWYQRHSNMVVLAKWVLRNVWSEKHKLLLAWCQYYVTGRGTMWIYDMSFQWSSVIKTPSLHSPTSVVYSKTEESSDECQEMNYHHKEINISKIYSLYSDYVWKYFDVKKRAFLFNFMRDFGHFYAKFLFVNHPRNNRCEIRAFVLSIMRVFPI